MKQQLLLSVLALLGAGVIGGCCNSCGSDCGEAVEVETVEIVPCPSGKDCPGKPHYHLRHKGTDKPASPCAAGSNSGSGGEHK